MNQTPKNLENILSLKEYVIRWIVWRIGGSVPSQAMRFGSNMLLTRLLVPELFGLMTLVYVFITAVQMLSDIGISQSIIQNKRGDDPNFLNTAWTMQVIRGVILWVCYLLIAFPVATFYKEPQLLWLIPVVGLNTLISGFNSTSLLTLSRHMEFRKLAIFEVGVQAVSIPVMIVWAYFNRTVWALVVGGIVPALVQLVWSHRLISGVHNRLFWNKLAAKSILNFGKWILLMTAGYFLAVQAEKIILSKLTSLETLGAYNIAFTLAIDSNIALLMIQLFGAGVMFPFFSKQSELPRENLRGEIMHLRWFLLMGGAVCLAPLVGFGDILVKTLYDNRYWDAAWMLPILSLGCWFTIVSETINPVLFAIGQPRYAALSRFIQLIFLVIGLPLGFFLGGLVGAVIAVVLSQLPFYAAITYGSWKERLLVIEQDIRATVLLMGLLALVLMGRIIFGLGLPIILNQLST